MRERLPKLTSAAAVIAAISECKQLGREAFLSRHGFRRSREYTLYYGGAPFDSKAIYGVALGIEHPDRGPFSSVDFRGGDALVAPSLRALGFVVERTTQYPSGNVGGWIVLVENEVTEGGRYDDWKDATGERYHFPNQYRGLVRSGAQFVYYRGVRRRESKRGTPEYFGAGVVGDVWRDQDVPLEAPKSHWKWFAEICDYAPFLNPVPAKSDGRSVERIAQNRWGVGVRRIERSQFEQLCALGGRATSPSAIAAVLLKEAPRLEEISPQLLAKGESLLIPRRLPEGSAGDSGGSAPRSNHSKVIGDRAEQVVLCHLRASLPARQKETIHWRAGEGETPGWDIDYKDEQGELVAVEVKGTTAPRLVGCVVTRNEWAAAMRLGAQFNLTLVGSCLTRRPIIEFLSDPHALSSTGQLEVAPDSWLVRRLGRRE